ncbi:MAG: hypothetical protein HYT28_01215 [Parcubacteria group bacterium]|nr:hypothetical protein [Parcubacteria group bacterium]
METFPPQQINEDAAPRTSLKIFEIAVFIIVVAVLGWYFFRDAPRKEELSLSGIIQSEDIARCAELKDQVLQIECKTAIESSVYSKKALLQNDPAVCDSISDAFLKERCKDPFTSRVAIQNKDASACPSGKDMLGKSIMFDPTCVATINNATALDAYRALVLRAIQEKNESLCNTAEKKLQSACVGAVRDGIKNAQSEYNPFQFGGSVIAN